MFYVKKIALVVCLFLSTLSFAEEKRPERASHFSLGTGLQGTGSSIGGALSITSPYFSRERFAFQFIYGNLADGQFNDLKFNTYSIAFLWAEFLTERLRGYWAGGLTLLAPPHEISDNLAVSGYGTLGLEYFPALDSPFSFYTELGGIRAVKGVAEKVEGNPRFGRGIYYTSGIKVHF